MSHTISQEEQSHIANNMRTLQNANVDSLEKLARSCCLPVRSERMRILQGQFSALAKQLGDSMTVGGVDAGIEQVEKCGEAIGGLFATCCTPTREKIYIELMKNLGRIHTELWKLKGVNH